MGMFYGLTSLYDAVTGASVMTGIFFQISPINTIILCVVTRTAVGYLTGLLFKLYHRADRRHTVCYFLGGFGRLYDPVVLENGKIAFDSIVPAMLVKLSPALIALVVLLVLSASMSTLASLVLTSSSTMTLDLIYRDKKSLPGEVEEGTIDDIVAEKIERRKVVVMRVLIMFFIAISLLIALNPPTFIAQLMGISWGALAGAFLAPFMLGLYWRGVTTASVWACFIWGVGLTVVNMVAGNPINPINCGAIAMLGGFPVVWLVSLLTPKMPRDIVARMFECYKKK